MIRVMKVISLAIFVFTCLTFSISAGLPLKEGDAGPPPVPKLWDDEAIRTIEVPLASAGMSPVHVDSAYYYSLGQIVQIYKSYPIYAPGKEPPGYLDWLKQQEPENVFDPSKLKTMEDWIKAGERVFDFGPVFQGTMGPNEVRNPEWYKKTAVPLTRDGVMPFARYVIRKKGEIEIGNVACATCHTRVMPDGTVIKGAQGNFPFDRSTAFNFRDHYPKANNKERYTERNRQLMLAFYDTPWLKDNPNGRLSRMSIDEIAEAHEAIPPGVMARHRSSLFFPPQIPDLIGLKDWRYLDHTGLVQQRSIADLMRYAALTQGGDNYARFGDYIPFEPFQGKLPDAKDEERYSDEQLYAVALYLYSLKPPPNPNKFDQRAARGKRVFEREGCATCHTPPLYTNNKLTPASGFTPPEDHFKQFHIMNVYVGTDPRLALSTRRGTGYYKVPSLRGVWYRGPFEHNGSVATLEDWFDPRRLKDDYVPTGFLGAGVKTRAVKGHPYGLQLSEKERSDMIAFLKTL